MRKDGETSMVEADSGKLLQTVFIRHGQSEWNEANRFTGWADIDLSESGIKEASSAGAMLKRLGYYFDLAFTSYLKRAIKTLHIVLEENEQLWLPEHKSWMLNERHYGALQGLDKDKAVRQFGAEQVRLWRRGYDEPVPPVSAIDPRFPGNDAAYRHISVSELPKGETLKDTEARVVRYWLSCIAPEIRKGKRVLVVAHGNSLRALIKHIENLTPYDIMSVEPATGKPLVYEFTADLQPIRSSYLK